MIQTPQQQTRRRPVGGIVGAVLLGLIVCATVLAPLLAPHDPLAQDLLHTNAAPGEHGYLLGTDQLGRDMLSRFLHGARTPLLVGVLAVLCGGVFGTALGLISGFARGWWDQLLARLADIQLALPSILLALMVLSFGGRSTAVLVLVIALTGWPAYFRLVRSRVLALRQLPYVEASLLGGLPTWRILLRDLLPGVRGLVAVTATLDLSRAVLMEAGLSYLGLGAQPPNPDWGLMVAEGQGQLLSAWWIAVLPGIGLVLLVLGANLLGERLSVRRVAAS
ncbi:ABC transporter permease [Saccharopolyspora sp. K220]|uniref:ABC transporter permease n=1 Tax=Saccharopolyspora soli TaxID=2926618 RepID=UPI001F57A576|nr:ABC transporter permease [Saccharopolyspora soli]MCI2423347.1 ABC transporter permease [Saccharopolyspora soli]